MRHGFLAHHCKYVNNCFHCAKRDARKVYAVSDHLAGARNLAITPKRHASLTLELAHKCSSIRTLISSICISQSARAATSRLLFFRAGS